MLQFNRIPIDSDTQGQNNWHHVWCGLNAQEQMGLPPENSSEHGWMDGWMVVLGIHHTAKGQ
jgi:hypothetical protein